MKAGNDKVALGCSLLISGLVHTLSGVVAAAATSVPAPAPPGAEAPPVEFMVLEPEKSPRPAEDDVRQDDPKDAAERDAVAVPPRAPRRRPSPEQAPDPAPDPAPAHRPGVAEPEPAPRTPDRREEVTGVPGGLRLDPRAVALAAIASDGPSAPHVSAEDAPAPTDAQRTAELNERHSRFLSESANAKSWATRKEPPRFKPRRDGTYVYDGHAFSAKIRPDGSIVFSDRDGINFDRTGTSDGQSLGARFSFDLTDGAYRRRGADPYQAERDYVLRGSEDLRDELAAKHREKENERALLRLSGRLERTWGSGRDAASRRRAIFELWDGCSEDDVGRRARAAIVSFVAERLPAGSAEAFTEEELARLNRERQSDAPFRPYR